MSRKAHVYAVELLNATAVAGVMRVSIPSTGLGEK
jgi:hypothetical protein